MTALDKFKQLSERKRVLSEKLSGIKGVRNFYLKKMEDMGFKSESEMRDYYNKKMEEKAVKEKELASKLQEFEARLTEAERLVQEL